MIGCCDDIMVYLMYVGFELLMVFKMMEFVCKGCGLIDEMVEVMKENNVLDWYLDFCCKIKYMFFKVYVVVYVLMVVRIVYFKVYYLLYYYVVYFIIRVFDFDFIIMIKDKMSICNIVKDMYLWYMDLGKKEKDVLIVLEIMNEMVYWGFWL